MMLVYWLAISAVPMATIVAARVASRPTKV